LSLRPADPGVHLRPRRVHRPDLLGDVVRVDGVRPRSRGTLDRSVDDDLAGVHALTTQPRGEQSDELRLGGALQGHAVGAEGHRVGVLPVILEAERTVEDTHRPAL